MEAESRGKGKSSALYSADKELSLPYSDPSRLPREKTRPRGGAVQIGEGKKEKASSCKGKSNHMRGCRYVKRHIKTGGGKGSSIHENVDN